MNHLPPLCNHAGIVTLCMNEQCALSSSLPGTFRALMVGGASSFIQTGVTVVCRTLCEPPVQQHFQGGWQEEAESWETPAFTNGQPLSTSGVESNLVGEDVVETFYNTRAVLFLYHTSLLKLCVCHIYVCYVDTYIYV